MDILDRDGGHCRDIMDMNGGQSMDILDVDQFLSRGIQYRDRGYCCILVW